MDRLPVDVEEVHELPFLNLVIGFTLEGSDVAL